MLIPWILMMAALTVEGKKQFDQCKAEDFKPKVCERYAPKPPPITPEQE